MRGADVDVIALQEVEADLAATLLREPWVRESWTLGTDPEGPDVERCGLLLLSRLPVREAAFHELGPHKAVTVLVVEAGMRPLVVAATHLSSDHTENGAGRRDAELTRIAEGLAGLDADLIVMGDFNDGDDTPQTALGMRDAWSEAHGADDTTPTFDPGNNPLAAVSSLTGRASRLDRVLLRGEGLRVRRAELCGDTPTAEGLHLSEAAPACHAWPRPFSTAPTRYAIGLGPTPPTADHLAAVAQRRLRGLAGVTLTRAEGGEVPTLR